MTASEIFDEARSLAAIAAASEQVGARPHDIGVAAPGYIHAVSPEHGEPVTFTPGELLPGWVADLLNAGKWHLDAAGVFIAGDAEAPPPAPVVEPVKTDW